MLALVLAAGVLAGCTGAPPLVPWLVGLDPVAGDDPVTRPLGNRLSAWLGAVPMVGVVDLADPRNAPKFESWRGPKLRLSVAMEPYGPFCLRAAYPVYWDGLRQYASGLVIENAPGQAPLACLDLLATRLYDDLRRQGL